MCPSTDLPVTCCPPFTIVTMFLSHTLPLSLSLSLFDSLHPCTHTCVGMAFPAVPQGKVQMSEDEAALKELEAMMA